MQKNLSSDPSVRAIAFYLPQFHPIPENDEWWGKGFTEWTNTAKAKTLFRDHYQPHVPADLGFYDLRLPESRIAQADMARENGIEGFCYYHYWFAGKRLIERPFNEVVESGEPNFPFCLCWANQTWTGIWHGAPNRILIEQTYPGRKDYEAHFNELIKAFSDPRYMTVDNKPIFIIYNPTDLPNSKEFVDIWQELAIKAGLPGLFLIGINHNDKWKPEEVGFDASILQKLPPKIKRVPLRYPSRKLDQHFKDYQLTIYDYEEVMHTFLRKETTPHLEIPCVIPNWDNTPRSNLNGLVLHNSKPEFFRAVLKQAIDKVANLEVEKRIIVIKSWNEWAEGNYLEPDIKFGHAYLDVMKEELDKSKG